MSHLTQPNKGIMEPVVIRLSNGKLKETWRTIKEKDMTEDEFAQEMKFYNHYHKLKHTAKSVGEWEAIHIFREELPAIAYDHIKAGDNPEYWKGILAKLKNQDNLKFQDKIKRAKEVSIIDIASRAGFQPRMNFIKCPFHDDGSASLKLYPDTNTWWCFGCNEGMSTVDFIMKLNKCDLKQAINYLT